MLSRGQYNSPLLLWHRRDIMRFMEEKSTEQSAAQPQAKKSWFNIWKLLTLVLLTIIVLGGAYYLGLKKNSNAPTPQASVAPSQTPQSSATASATPISSPKPTSTTVSAGVKTDAFIPYTIQIPNGWTNQHTYESTVDKLVITKGGYSLTIVEGGVGGGICTYPGEAPQQMSQTFTSFVGITGTQSQLRRGTSDSINYTVCEQKASGFGFPTQFGYITYITQSNPDSSILAEMDGMVASIAKQ